MSEYNTFPNVFEYITDSDSETPYTEASDYGYDSAYLLLNGGELFSMLLTLLAINFLLFFLSILRIPGVSRWCQRRMRHFAFAAYLRFGVEAYLELCAAALVQLHHVMPT